MANESVPLFNVQIDGVWHRFPKGTRVIEACEQVGVFVPRYCYHKMLSWRGNCRMCLIEMGFPRLGPERKPELGPAGQRIIKWMRRRQICSDQVVARRRARGCTWVRRSRQSHCPDGASWEVIG